MRKQVLRLFLLTATRLCCCMALAGITFFCAGKMSAQSEQPAPAATAPASEPSQPQAAPAATLGTNPSSEPDPDNPQLKDSELDQGPFRIGGMDYTVALHDKLLALSPVRAAAAARAAAANFDETLGALEIRDAAGDIVYQDSFPYNVAEGQFAQRVTATAQLMAGHGGAAIVLHYQEESPGGRALESWQVFGMIGGRLASFGAPLPLGQGQGIATGGVVAGVMVKNGISVVPFASTADQIEFRVWEGHFSIDVPVQVDWAAGQWSQGQECYELGDGNLRPKGCNLRVEAAPHAGGGDPGYVQLFAGTDGDARNAQQVEVRGDSRLAFVETRAVVNWMADGDRVRCGFDDVWLHVRVDDKDGWVRGDADFASLGLAAGAAPRQNGAPQ